MRTLTQIRADQAAARKKIQAQMMAVPATRNLVLHIKQDDAGESPREWDNMALMCLAHGRYSLPNETCIVFDNHEGWQEVYDELVHQYNPVAILPVYMYDHSGLALSTSPFSCRWDSGQVGFILVEGDKGLTEAEAEAICKDEVETFHQYVSGEVYGYVIEDADSGEVVDSCWGHYGREYAQREGEEALAYHQKNSAPL